MITEVSMRERVPAGKSTLYLRQRVLIEL